VGRHRSLRRRHRLAQGDHSPLQEVATSVGFTGPLGCALSVSDCICVGKQFHLRAVLLPHAWSGGGTERNDERPPFVSQLDITAPPLSPERILHTLGSREGARILLVHAMMRRYSAEPEDLEMTSIGKVLGRTLEGRSAGCGPALGARASQNPGQCIPGPDRLLGLLGGDALAPIPKLVTEDVKVVSERANT
jgi:hypothetical protein